MIVPGVVRGAGLASSATTTLTRCELIRQPAGSGVLHKDTTPSVGFRTCVHTLLR